MTSPEPVPGYTHDDPGLAASPVNSAELDALLATVLFGPADQEALRTAGEVLSGQVEQVLDVWYGFVGAHPHLVAYFSTPDGTPIADYLARVRARFGRWIVDTCTRPYDERWLAYQQEIALRHTAPGKNQTDHADSVPHIPLRYIIAFVYPITATIRPFLAAGGHDEQQVDAMFQAWFKAVTLQVALWSQPYAGRAW
jgi:hypothetical protein